MVKKGTVKRLRFDLGILFFESSTSDMKALEQIRGSFVVRGESTQAYNKATKQVEEAYIILGINDIDFNKSPEGRSMYAKAFLAYSNHMRDKERCGVSPEKLNYFLHHRPHLLGRQVR